MAGLGNVMRAIKQTDIYQRTKASWIYDAYWSVVNKKYVEDRRKEVRFYRDVLVGLQKGDLIFDVGANRGYKTSMFLELAARVVCVEPDETCQRMLKQQFLSFRLHKRAITIVNKAVSDNRSLRKMLVDVPGSAVNTLSNKWAETLRTDSERFGERLAFRKTRDVETVTIEDLVSEFGRPFYIKIDVEGHELSALQGMRAPVPYLSFEINLPEFRQEGIECIRCLENLTVDGVFNYTADCRKGMAFPGWLTANECASALSTCDSSSIEVFWKTS